MLGRPLAIWILALVSVIAGLVTLVVTLQFLEIIPWAGDEATFWGGKWAGVILYGVETFVFFAVAVGWLTLRPWAPMITLFFGLFGFFVPFMSYLAGTELLSSALAPMIFSALIILLAFRGSARRRLPWPLPNARPRNPPRRQPGPLLPKQPQASHPTNPARRVSAPTTCKRSGGRRGLDSCISGLRTPESVLRSPSAMICANPRCFSLEPPG